MLTNLYIPLLGLDKLWSDLEQTYVKTLKASNIHHVIAALWDHAHHFYSFLKQARTTHFKTKCLYRQKKMHSSVSYLWKELLALLEINMFLYWELYLQLCRIRSCLFGNFKEILWGEEKQRVMQFVLFSSALFPPWASCDTFRSSWYFIIRWTGLISKSVICSLWPNRCLRS